MIQQTKGIVLSSIKYAESSIICRIYTESLGLQSYIVNGVRKKKGKNTYYQPLNILDLEVYHKEKSGFNALKSVRSTTNIKRRLFIFTKVLFYFF